MISSRFTTAKKIAEKFDLSYQAVNRYSDAGLLNVAFKKGNIRYYERLRTERRLTQIVRMTRDGYSLLLIRKKLLHI